MNNPWFQTLSCLSLYLLFLPAPAIATTQMIELGPWQIELYVGEHASINGRPGKQQVVLYRKTRAPLKFASDTLPTQNHDSVRKLRKKLQILQGSFQRETLNSGLFLVRMENKAKIFWVLQTGDMLSLDKAALDRATARFDAKRVSIKSRN